MKTKNIFKTLILAAVLVSACGKNEIANDENTEKKGFALPVTVNVTREGNDATKATYNETNKKLEFSAGDKLFVTGYVDEDRFAGTLDYDAVSGKFSGTVTVENEYTGNIDDLMKNAYAFLLPAGYGSYGVFSIVGSGYGARINLDLKKAFALTKAAAVEQFSVEYASYSSGFALAPMNAIVTFTISGLTANKKVDVSFSTGLGTISGNVTTSTTGVATFAVGVSPDNDEELGSCTLTVDGNNIAMPTKTTVAGHIYNISRSAASAAEGHALSASAVGEIVGTDGKAYAAADKDNLPSGVTAVAKICYVSGSNGLALALTDEGQMNWSTAQTTCAAHTPAITGGTWKLATKDEWDNMISAAGSYSALRDGFSSVGGTNMGEECYWSSTEFSSEQARDYDFCDGEWSLGNKEATADYVRACLAF
jgi:hypothetical protein